MSISALFPDAQRLVLRIQADLEEYESGRNVSESFEQELGFNLTQAGRAVVEMEAAAQHEGGRRDMWEKRVRSLSDEVSVLRTTFQRIQQSVQSRRWQQQQQQYAQQQQLQGGGYPYAQGYDPNGNANPQLRNELFDGRTQSSRQNLSALDSYSRQADSLQRSTRMVDELHEMGTKALQSLGSQRNTLKNAHRKALDVANILGMSSSVLKIIERSDKVNAYVTYGCMVFTVLVVLLIWWYIR